MTLTRDMLRRVPTIRSGSAITTTTPGPVTRNEGDTADGDVLVGYFCRFGEWNEIDSIFEGRFLERVDPAAFNRTLNGRGANAKVLFNHGHDYSMGERILGKPTLIEPRAEGPYYEVPLFDGLPPDLVEGLRAGAYGASYMFRVRKDEWTDPTTRTDWNPAMLPERTIVEAELYEFGPVTFPADPFASAGLRSRIPLDDDIVEAIAEITRTSDDTDQESPVTEPADTPEDDPLTEHSASPQDNALADRLLAQRFA